MKALLVLVFAATALCTGCMSVTTRTAPGLDLKRFHRYFVEQPFNENHHLDELIAEELRRNGYEAMSGPMTMMPENTEVVVSYDARWTWDFKTYLIDLTVEMQTAHTKKKIADGRCYQPSASPAPPEVAVRKLVSKMLAK